MINWNAIGEQQFNVFDHVTNSFWAEDGFTNEQDNAKVFTQIKLTLPEKELIDSGSHSLLSA